MVYFGRKLTDEQIEQIEQELTSFAKLGLANTFTAVNTFNENVVVLNDKLLRMGYTTGEIKLELGGLTSTQNGVVRAPRGDLILNGNTISVSNKKVVNLANPTGNNDAANKAYVDGKAVVNVEKGSITGWTKQLVSSSIGNKYYVSKTLADLGLENKKIVNIVIKENNTGKHIQFSYFNKTGTNEIIFNLFQFGDTADIITNLNSMVFIVSYMN